MGERRPRSAWGQWKLRDEFLEHAGHDPFFDVTHLASAELALDEILMINEKDWADGQAMKDLIEAISHILKNPDQYPVAGRNS